MAGRGFAAQAAQEDLRELVEGQWELFDLRRRNESERKAPPVIEVPQPQPVAAEPAIAPPQPAPESILTRPAQLEAARAPVVAPAAGFTDTEIVDLVTLLDALDD
jgi:hypothetical protein